MGRVVVGLPTHGAGEPAVLDGLTVYDSAGRILVEKRLSGD